MLWNYYMQEAFTNLDANFTYIVCIVLQFLLSRFIISSDIWFFNQTIRIQKQETINQPSKFSQLWRRDEGRQQWLWCCLCCHALRLLSPISWSTFQALSQCPWLCLQPLHCSQHPTIHHLPLPDKQKCFFFLKNVRITKKSNCNLDWISEATRLFVFRQKTQCGLCCLPAWNVIVKNKQYTNK